MNQVVLVTPPASEPLTVQNVKDHCKLPPTNADDDYIKTFVIPGARQACEDEIRRVLITQTWRYELDGFPGMDPRYESYGYPEILLPKPPFQAINSFTYVDVAGIVQTLVQTNPDGTTVDGQFYGYQLIPGSETQPARLLPPWARPWPPSRRLPAAVKIEQVCGYGPVGSPAVTPIPPAIFSALLLQSAHLYFNREAVTADGGKELARGVKELLGPYVNRIA